MWRENPWITGWRETREFRHSLRNTHHLQQEFIYGCKQSGIEQFRSRGISIDALIREHRTLDEKVSELSERSFLTEEDHMHLARLKKEKLRVKDRIAVMSNEE